ncbi:NAD(P)H-hydrate epimerase [Striga asiatica]|uniref:NAD(P)H-hydrate epimerase n=1 Tax=Striga asiatica TaxID=4170 RepID=A0A5A7Q8S1_STRAF|nr:NAD(P)H-hydrate epimerase [Striga asiatica]
MAGGQSLKGSRLSRARGWRLDRGSTSGIDPPLLLILGSPTSRRRWGAKSVATARKNRGELLPSLLQNCGEREIGEGEKPRILGKRCSGLSAKDRRAFLLARGPKGLLFVGKVPAACRILQSRLLLLGIEIDGCAIRASSGCCSAARIFAKGQPSTVALGLFIRRELKLFAGVFPLSIALSLTPGTRRTGAALAGNPVAEAWCSCRRMAGGQSLKGSRLSRARGWRLDRGSTLGIDPPLLLVLGSPTSRRRLSSGRKKFRTDDCCSIERI